MNGTLTGTLYLTKYSLLKGIKRIDCSYRFTEDLQHIQIIECDTSLGDRFSVDEITTNFVLAKYRQVERIKNELKKIDKKKVKLQNILEGLDV